MALTFGILALIFLTWYVATSLNIVSYLKGNGQRADLRWLRFKAFGYAKNYKDLTLEISSKVGKLYYSFTTSSVLFAITLFPGIVAAYLEKH